MAPGHVAPDVAVGVVLVEEVVDAVVEDQSVGVVQPRVLGGKVHGRPVGLNGGGDAVHCSRFMAVREVRGPVEEACFRVEERPELGQGAPGRWCRRPVLRSSFFGVLLAGRPEESGLCHDVVISFLSSSAR